MSGDFPRGQKPHPPVEGIAVGAVQRAREKIAADTRKRAQGATPQARRQPPPVRSNPNIIGAAISRPAPMPQWPLAEEINSSAEKLPGDRPLKKGPPPQRPPRPSNVPSILDSSKIHEFAPSVPNRRREPEYESEEQPQTHNYPPPRPQYYDDDGTASSKYDSMSSQPSRVSVGSSVGSIPDFPVPILPVASLGPPRGSRSLGPPPPRRGPSSYYSQASYVSPIPEESSDNDSRHPRSFASSKAIPSSWGSAPPGADVFKDGQMVTEEDEENYDSDEEHGNRSSGSIENDDSTTLVRQASLGRRHKPSLRTIKSSNDPNSPSLKSLASRKEFTPSRSLAASASASPMPMKHQDYNESPTGGRLNERATTPDSSSASSGSSSSSLIDVEKIPMMLDPIPKHPRAMTPQTYHSNSSLVGLEKSLQPDTNANMLKHAPSMSDKVRIRKPPRLNIDAVKQAEARGSLTSLPDLIARATRLASNLDRGRTASRLGLTDLFNGSPGGPNNGQNRRSGLSDILNSFPNPGLNSPSSRPHSRWPSPFGGSKLANSQSAEDLSDPKKERSTCNISPDDNCVTTDLDSSDKTISNATTGSLIPSILKGAESNFSVSLEASTVLSIFSSTNLSCTSENALVTFTEDSKRRRSLPLFEVDVPMAEPRSIPTTTSTAYLKGRATGLVILRSEEHAVTSNGIVFAASTKTSKTSTTTAAVTSATAVTDSTTTSSSSYSSSTSTSTSSDTPSDNDVDFAQVAVLFVLQETGELNSAVTAQQRIQSSFSGTFSGGKLNLGHSYSLDFDNFAITMPNGTTVGGN
ncbi:MAG: hypothetical protein M1834_005323 [Cirrosporium novae-zelandiae]|nr:MAG: hypothetical protein M1834_005323 [Cirrosporium novae-zelandiae]